MPEGTTLSATVAVKDITKGKAFYSGILGLKQVDENPAGVMYESGGKLFIYQSGTAGSGKATCFNLQVPDLAVMVADLKAKGVVFEDYGDMPNAEKQGDIYVMGPFKTAWFKDPDGNIIAIGSQR